MRVDIVGREKVWHNAAVYAAASILFLIIVTSSARAQVSPKQLSKEDVIQLLKGDVSPKRVGEMAREHGIDFELTPQTEHEIRKASADNNTADATNQLLDTLRKLQLNPGTPRPKTDDAATKASLEATIAKLQSTIGDLGVQSGLIANTRADLEALKHKGDRQYYEFTLLKGAKPQAFSTVALQLKETDPKHGKYNLNVTSDDKTIEKKDKNQSEPVQFYTGRNHMLYEIVIWTVSTNKVTGYLSTPKNAAIPITANPE